jgi:sarcosine oxidase
MGKTWDVIVLGTGGVGSAALMHLARRGLRVLGLDQFPPAHDKGSSHGETRIIRKAYFEHPDYVPLLQRAYRLWDELQEAEGRTDLFQRTGLLQVGPEKGAVIAGVKAAARQHGLELERIDSLPPYLIPHDSVAVLERDAGFLLVEDCVKAHLHQALLARAELKTGFTVTKWRADGHGFSVDTSEGEFHAASLVITAGAWAPQLLAGLGVKMEVKRKALLWLATEETSRSHLLTEGCPCFFYERPEGQFYGFPQLSRESGVKLACHTGGEIIDDPILVDRRLHSTDSAPVSQFAQEWLPETTSRIVHHAVCLYTMSPDEHFIVDRHPEHSKLVFTAGLSGHGFKFTSVLGEMMADLAMTGKTPQPAEFLGISRFELASSMA